MECNKDNFSVCHKCDSLYDGNGCNCGDYNRNIAAGKPVVESECVYSETSFNEKTASLKCYTCENNRQCDKVLSPRILTAPIEFDDDRICLRYSEFSGFAAVIPPGYITVDLEKVTEVQTIQFLLWDNLGNGKNEACDVVCRYRLLASDYEGDLEYDVQSRDVKPKDGGSVRWTVLYDTLRHGYNGWQVFNLDKPERFRYIRLHMMSNSVADMPCNIVKLEAYSRKLVGYRYGHIPSFEALIETEDSSKVMKTDGLQNIKYNSFIIFPKKLHELLGCQIEETRRRGQKQLAARMSFLKNDLNRIINDMSVYDRHVMQINDRIFKNTDKILQRSNVLKLVSILIGVISLILNFVPFDNADAAPDGEVTEIVAESQGTAETGTETETVAAETAQE